MILGTKVVNLWFKFGIYAESFVLVKTVFSAFPVLSVFQGHWIQLTVIPSLFVKISISNSPTSNTLKLFEADFIPQAFWIWNFRWCDLNSQTVGWDSSVPTALKYLFGDPIFESAARFFVIILTFIASIGKQKYCFCPVYEILSRRK